MYTSLPYTYAYYSLITAVFSETVASYSFKRFTKFVPSVQLFITAGKTAKKVSSTV